MIEEQLHFPYHLYINFQIGFPNDFSAVFLFCKKDISRHNREGMPACAIILRILDFTKLGLDDRGSIPERDNIFLFCVASTSDLGHNQPPSQ
jgi:hypothetical protein